LTGAFPGEAMMDKAALAHGKEVMRETALKAVLAQPCKT
jgi:hypothetical protein